MADGPAVPHDTPMLPLAALKGQRPPWPQWFNAAVTTPYETRFVDVEGAKVHYQIWGSPEKPGLLLVHGNGAHAHWYDFIAPSFSEDYCVVAMTFGGMGDSDPRPSYSVETFGREQLAVCEDAGLFRDGRKPFIAAHSFGGFVTLWTGAHFGDRFAGLVVIDTHIVTPGESHQRPPDRTRPNRIYPRFDMALARFRLAPAQPCENDFIVDYIGRHSLKEVDLEGQTGWTWKFDPFIWRRFDADVDVETLLKKTSCRLSLMRGAESVLVTDRAWSYLATLRRDMEMHSIEGAQHHVMLDQPHRFIEQLRQQLQSWS